MPSKLTINFLSTDQNSRCRKFPGEDYSRTSLRTPQTAFTVLWKLSNDGSRSRRRNPLCPSLLGNVLLKCKTIVSERAKETQIPIKNTIHTFSPSSFLKLATDKKKTFGRPHMSFTLYKSFSSSTRGARSNVTSNKGGFQLIYLSIIAYWVRLLHYYIRMPQRYLQMDKITSSGPHARQI